MKIVRLVHDGAFRYGVLEGDRISLYTGSPYADRQTGSIVFEPTGTDLRMDTVELTVPCEPSKIIGVGLNYRAHIEETGFKAPSSPILFLKPTTSLVGPEEDIVRPKVPGRVDYEGEVGVVIGRTAKGVPAEKAMEYVLGYTCANDVSARYFQDNDGQWTRGKGFDTFCPVGPCVATLPVPEPIRVETLVNGETRQSSDTSCLIFGIPTLIEIISAVMTLLPGDVILTGTPEGVGEINVGDVVEVRVEGVGVLRNYVTEE
jgi:2-keto-4-pentenoate hydratase/2-oxohepta-3-ene-1,7-dioic acid hydratase in catechol pathway